MTMVRFEISMSLDGFVAGPNPTLEDPLGEGGERLHEWIFGLASWRATHGREGGATGPDDDLLQESVDRTGATVMGRKMFSGGEGPWEHDPNAGGWWGDDPPFRKPVFILTQYGREPVVHRNGTTFNFVTDGIEVALDPDFAAWRLYDNRGWPARYLFDRRGVLTHFHLGEGEYQATELAVQDALREIEPELALPDPLEPLRPEDAPGVELEPQTADVVLPAERERLELVRDWVDGEDWIEAADAGASAQARFRAGGAWAVLSGAGREPGLYQTDGTVVADEAGLRLHAFQFEPLPPSAG